MMIVKEAYDKATLILEEANIENARLNAEVLICNIYSWDRSKFILNLFEKMNEEKFVLLNELIDRRLKHEPLQYITGIQNFYGRDFNVNPNVLIPRPETEILIEELIKEAKTLWREKSLTVLDVGTGSGAISITLSLENNIWNVHGVDISNEALLIAADNSKNLGADVTFHQGDLFTPLLDKEIYFDIIVSNPPYISSIDIPQLMPEVKNFEPILALDGGIDGLEFYRKILKDCKKILKQPGIIAFEIGLGQEKEIETLLKNYGAKKIKKIADFQGISRIIVAIF